MYGRGNYAPQFRQGLQRPMPPYQQQLAGQPGNSVPMQSVIHQGGPPHGPTPHGPGYLYGPPGQRNMPHQGPLVSASNIGHPFHHPSPHLFGAQQNFVPLSQNPQPSRPPPPSMGHRAPPLPPPPFMQLPPPPPPPQPIAAGFFPPESGKQQSAETQMPAVAPQPPPVPPSSPPMAPPPPSSRSQTQLELGSTPISDEDMSMKQSVLVGLPPAPPKPADEKVIRNIEVLCQFIVKNGPEFEEMARKNEYGNPEFNFLVGGDPGSEAASAHEYFLWMKKKCTIENGLHKDQGQRDLSQKNINVEPFSGPNSLPNVGTAHSPADSDVDMEDDITQSDKEHGAYKSVEDAEQEPILASDASEMQKQDSKNDLQHLNNNSSALKPSQSVKDGAESKPENPVGEPGNVHSPFRLIQNYASDDSSDDGGEKCFENVTTCSESRLTKDQDDLHAIQGDLQEDDLNGRTEGFNANAASDGKYVSGSSGVYSAATHKDVKKGDEKNSRSAVEVDKFGRLVKEGASEGESDDSHHLRRRGRRDRSRSRSRSPYERRRSPRRRKERRSRSRSWSPKRQRSRSRSPYRPGGDFANEKLRKGKVQTRECFDFLKGRCYRGASCRYLHQEVDKDENPRRYNSKQHHVEDKHDSRDLVTPTCDERNIAKGIYDAAWSSVSHQDFEKVSTDVKTIVDSGKEVQVSDASDKPISHLPVCENQLSSCFPSTNEQAMNHPKAEGSVGAYHRVDEDLLKKDDSSQIDSSNVQTSTISPSGLSASEPCLNKTSSELTDFSVQVSHLPPPPLPQQASNAPRNPNMLGDYNYMAPAGSLPPQSIPVASGPLYQAPLPNQQSHYPPLANPGWSASSQPRPPHMIGPSVPGNPLQFQHGNFPLRNDFPGQSHVGGFSHHTHHLPSNNILAQPFAGSNLARDDRYPQFPSQSGVSSSSFVPGVVPQPVPFQGDSSNIGDRDNSSSFFDVGGTRISTHYNPYASTFDQPLSTRFSSIAFSQGREASTGVQYDPLFDSIDPKLSQNQEHAANNSDIILKLSNRHNVLDVEENNKQKMVGAVASSASPENDEFGETADAEIGAVENGSPSNLNDADVAEGDIEIDQVKTEGRSMKSKDSRSMKLFKVAVANFVKDILKPQWRQGNMSKEVFKTIVKKTVDKVSGAMKNHRLPKSQAKIDHYIDSSRRKLTQLVEGYVSKYKS